MCYYKSQSQRLIAGTRNDIIQRIRIGSRVVTKDTFIWIDSQIILKEISIFLHILYRFRPSTYCSGMVKNGVFCFKIGHNVNYFFITYTYKYNIGRLIHI